MPDHCDLVQSYSYLIKEAVLPTFDTYKQSLLFFLTPDSLCKVHSSYERFSYFLSLYCWTKVPYNIIYPHTIIEFDS